MHDIIIVIRSVLNDGHRFYMQAFLDKCLCELAA